MKTLFDEIQAAPRLENLPLAARMRPRTLAEYLGQEKAVGPDTWLRRAIEKDALSSVILYGPAGTGKTTLARIIADHTQAEFAEVSALSGSVADLRREIDAAKKRLSLYGRRTILFVDEIHRFSRSQQDSLLHATEMRDVILIGATTENPYFEVNTALLSRSRIVELKSLTDSDIEVLLETALESERGLKQEFSLTPEAKAALVSHSGGDARFALTSLELASQMAEAKDKDGRVLIQLEDVVAANPRGGLPYDKNKDFHYDIISAFIKSMRGSDPDATLYWLARMIDGGEDPKFIARRIFIAASEDVGNADPQAILVAEAAFKAAEVIGYPECRINLAQAALYLALAPKSNAAEAGIDAALQEVRKGPLRPVPDHLRDRHRPGSTNYGSYKYPHNYPGAWVDQRYLPEGLDRGAFFAPSDRGWEGYRVDACRRNQWEAGDKKDKA